LVWHEGQFDLVSVCVASHYIRHDEQGDRTVTRDAYAAEIAKIRQERPDIRVVVYDHSFEGNRAWFRFAFKWTDTKTGEPRSRAGMQSYRIEDGKLAETWLSMQPRAQCGAMSPRKSVGPVRRDQVTGRPSWRAATLGPDSLIPNQARSHSDLFSIRRVS
jgi:hypothetical protein